KVKVKQANNLVGAGALGGAFWGLFIGLLFGVPWLGLAMGVAGGATAGKLSDCGLDDEFVKEVGRTIEPGHSALFLMVEYMTEDKVLPELARHKSTLLRTNLNSADEARLRDTFGVVETV
ncbi:MAG: DUF1269 domain-containing protein, partial [Anaerolineae bacterium]|nr:DUF1269 domain-containing protein [Anaerolineae bacterium]